MKSAHIISIILGRKHESIDMYKFRMRFQIIQVTGFDKLCMHIQYTKVHQLLQARRTWLTGELPWKTATSNTRVCWLLSLKHNHSSMQYKRKKYCKAASYGRPLQMATSIKLYNLSFLKWRIPNQSHISRKCWQWMDMTLGVTCLRPSITYWISYLNLATSKILLRKRKRCIQYPLLGCF